MNHDSIVNMNTATINVPLPRAASSASSAQFASSVPMPGASTAIVRRTDSTPRPHVFVQSHGNAGDALQPQMQDRRQTHANTLQLNNLIVFSSPSGGVGLSTLLALTALTLYQKHVQCALLDADLTGGGLAVLLGVEHEPGLSLQDLDTPLGHIEGEALNLELPHWEHMPVLAHTPWRGDNPDRWQMQAATQAMCEANQLVLADVGRAQALQNIPELALVQQVVAVELSVLGLARAKAHLTALRRIRESFAGSTSVPQSPIIVAMEPRGAPRRSAATTVATAEAIAYLGADILGPVRHTPTLCSDILEGLGIREVPRRNRRVVGALAEQLVEHSTQRSAKHSSEQLGEKSAERSLTAASSSFAWERT